MADYTFGTRNEYKTRDLHEAAFLYAKSKKLLRMEGDGREFWFVFDQAEDCELLVDTYWSKEAQVIVKEYVDALRTLKDRIFARKT